MASHDAARQQLAAALRAGGPTGVTRVVAVHGPLGVGKTRALAAVAGQPVRTRESTTRRIPQSLLLLDGVDDAAAASAARRQLDLVAPGTTVVVAGRRPVTSWPGWDIRVASVVPVGTWTPQSVRTLARCHGITAPAELDTVEGLSGGVPLIASCVCRALNSGTPAGARGALADAAAREIRRRLGTEASLARILLPVVAAVGGVDEDLLAWLGTTAGRAFEELRALTVTQADLHGITVREPYRTILDLAFRWRRPVTHHTLTGRAAGYRRQQVATTADGSVRARLTDQYLMLTARPPVREALFPGPGHALRVRPSAPRDDTAVDRLLYRWARLEGLNPRRADRMLELWQSTTGSEFHLVVDDADEPVGMANLTRVTAATRHTLEPLLQQHTRRLVLPPEEDTGGITLGMMVDARNRPAVRAVLLRHILGASIEAGRIVVSTPWPPYQELSSRLGLRALGETRHDFYGCGRRSSVFVRSFSAGALPQWLRRLQDPVADALAVAVREALEHLGDPGAVVDSPLCELFGPPRAPTLVASLRREIDALRESPSRTDAEAGTILHRYYVRRAGGHDILAHGLHLSRATYFRRLQHGIQRITESFRQLNATD